MEDWHDLNSLQLVRASTQRVVATAQHVQLNKDRLLDLAHEMAIQQEEPIHWDEHGWHYCEDRENGGEKTATYIFVLDAINFCFWPIENIEYEHLALTLKKVMETSSEHFVAEKLATLSVDQFLEWFDPLDVALAEQRTIRIREVGQGLLRYFEGSIIKMIQSANHSACHLVDAIISYFPGFRDHSVYNGDLVHFYKRAQIFVADLWGAFHGVGLGQFDDIDQLTMFADYRVPQMLYGLGVLVYNQDLVDKIENRQEILPGSPEEIEIRSFTIQAVEELRNATTELGRPLLSIQIDWLLWQRGEAERSSLPPHHRTMTVFY